MKNKILWLLFSLSVTISSCGDYSHLIHIDENKKAIIACNGGYLKRVDIDGPKNTITYEGVDTIYFDKHTKASKISVGYNSINNGYILKLEANSSYKIISRPRNGDQGPFTLILTTDSKGNIIHNVNNIDCR